MEPSCLFYCLLAQTFWKLNTAEIQRYRPCWVLTFHSEQSRYTVGSFIVLKATFSCSLSTLPVISAVSLKDNTVPLMTHNLRCIRGRRGCSFSHDLGADHNVRMLTEHGLESLSRTELRTLLLQSDDRLLPSVSMATCSLQRAAL